MGRMGGPGRPPKKLTATAANESANPSSGPAPQEAEDVSENDISSPKKTTEHDHSYTAPQWLLQEKQTPKFFSVPIPPVATATLQAIQEWWNPESSSERKLRKQTKEALETIRQLKQDQKTQAKRIKNQTEKLSNFIKRKEAGIEEIRRSHEEDLQTHLDQLEKQIREEEEAKFQKVEEERKQKIEEEFNKQFETDMAEKRKLKGKSKEEEEPPEKKQKVDSTSESKDERKSEKLQQKINECQSKLDKLQEKKSEMVWLLKQVIKADAKRKAELLKEKKAAGETSTGNATT